MLENLKILLVGCGKMGTALISGWEKAGAQPSNIIVIEPAEEAAKALQQNYGVEVLADPEYVDEVFHPDIVVFAIKPDIMDEALKAYANFDKKTETFISIAAGKDIAFLESKLGSDAAIVRAMPNLPATIAKGVTVAVENANVAEENRKKCTALLEAVGEVAWVGDEALMDVVTAVSGSGPAYIFLLIESMVEAATKQGLTEEQAKFLVYGTIEGSVAMAKSASESAEELRVQVTSKGGTTEAALNVLLQDNGFKQLLTSAIEEAAKRSRALNT